MNHTWRKTSLKYIMLNRSFFCFFSVAISSHRTSSARGQWRNTSKATWPSGSWVWSQMKKLLTIWEKTHIININKSHCDSSWLKLISCRWEGLQGKILMNYHSKLLFSCEGMGTELENILCYMIAGREHC